MTHTTRSEHDHSGPDWRCEACKPLADVLRARMRWASVHWGNLHEDAWPSLARAVFESDWLADHDAARLAERDHTLTNIREVVAKWDTAERDEPVYDLWLALRVVLDAQAPTQATEEEAPTMSRAECQCPDDCDCDGRFACEVQPTGCDGTWTCGLVAGHDGWHQDGGHRWAPAPVPARDTDEETHQ